jgi:hypothetical protein
LSDKETSAVAEISRGRQEPSVSQAVLFHRPLPGLDSASQIGPLDLVRQEGASKRTKRQAPDGEAQSGKKSMAGYESQYFAYISETFPNKFGSWVEFDSAKVFYHRMVNNGLWSSYIAYCNDHCMFTDPTISSKTVFSMNCEVAKMMDKFPDLMHLLPYILKFVIPTDDDVPWILKSPADLKKVRLLFVEMSESSLFRLSQKASSSSLAIKAPEKSEKSQKSKMLCW